MNRRRWIAIGVALPLVLGAGAGLLAAPAARTAGPLQYPDLRMAQIADVSIVNTGSQLQLRFSATIVNVGAGAMELSASRPDAASAFSVSQRVYEGSGGSADLAVSGASLVWGGDGHSHWHVRDLESYELDRLDNGAKVGTGMKSGFCFFDTTAFRLTLPGAPSTRVYAPGTVCGQDNFSTTNLRMGISVGWGDRYGSGLPDQYIDVTNLTSGNYRLVATADAANRFGEVDEANNTTWVDLKLTLGSKGKGGNKVRVIGYGPLP
jgi:lysyl oxidase